MRGVPIERMPHLNTRLVNEVIDFLRANNGPDEKCRGHHTKTVNLPFAEVEAAIAIIKAQGELPWLEPYHISPVPCGCWQEQELADEVLRKKCDQLVAECFGGNLANFCVNVKQTQLLSPLEETHDGRTFLVKMGALAHHFDDSPYRIVMRYLDLIGRRDEFAWLKPYHMRFASKNTWTDPQLADEALEKKCDQILHSTCDNDLTRFCLQVSKDDLLTDLKETYAGEEVSVSMESLIGRKYEGSSFLAVQRYLEIIGRADEYEWLRPYHARKAPQGTWKDQNIADEVLRKKFDALLREKFENNIPRLCCEITQEDILEDLKECHAGREISVSMIGLMKALDSDRYQMVQRYLHIRGLSAGYTWFKPYHMSRASPGTWEAPHFVDELVRKKCDQILTEHFDGDITRFCVEVSIEQLRTPLKENYAGREISVRTQGVLLKGSAFSASKYAVVQRYLEIIGKSDEYAWFKPYHMIKAPQGTWEQPDLVDQVLRKKCEALIRDKFGNDIVRFCCEVTQEDLLGDLTENHAGREFSVSMLGALKSFNHSPYPIVKRFLHIRGLTMGYTWVKPYHMSYASARTWDQQEVIDEVLTKKCDQLLKERFDSDLTRFCCHVKLNELLSDLVETHAGRSISVSMHSLRDAFGDGYQIIRRYLQLRGFSEEYAWFQPHHMHKTPNGAWSKEAIDDVLKQKCDVLLEQKFGNDLTLFLRDVSYDDLLSDLEQTHLGTSLAVAMSEAAKVYGDSPYKMILRYLEILGLSERYSWFKPYHRSVAPNGTWSEQSIIDEVLEKKVDALLRDAFDNDLPRLCCEVTQRDLLGDLIETHEGREFVVSMGALGNKFGDSSYPMVKRYLHLRGLSMGYTWFKPYHMKMAPLRTWHDQRIIDEVLSKCCTRLLRDRFDNDLSRLCAELTGNHLRRPLMETHAGREISVSMHKLVTNFRGSPHAILERYFKNLGRPFPYTKACFIGSPETRQRRQRGDFSPADLSEIRRPDGTFDTSRYGFTNYTAPDKAAIRQFMIEAIEDAFQDLSVNYLGLETEQFLSLRALYERVNLAPPGSLIVEQDARTFAAMRSTINRLPNAEGKALRHVRLKHNALEAELAQASDRSFRFNVANLDYLGHMSQGKELALQLLLEKKLLDTEALIFVTLQDSELARARALKAGYGGDQAQALTDTFTRLGSLTGHSVLDVATLHYDGGSNGKVGSRMLWAAFKISRTEE